MFQSSSCRLTGAPLDLVLDLGRQPLGNGFLLPEGFENEYFYLLQCGFSEKSRLFQLIAQPSPELMFHQDYAFFSGTSETMKLHFSSFASSVIASGFLSESEPFIVELGSNDGIFLKHFAQRNIPHLGIEPSGAVADVAVAQGIEVLRQFFDLRLAEQIVSESGRADVVTAANVLCHIPNINELAQGIAHLLKPDGVLIFEDPYLGDVVRLTSYDQIYDEHVFLFSGLSVQQIFATVGMELINLEPQITHGGSMRYTLAQKGRHTVSPNVQKILEQELNQGLHRTQTFLDLAARVEKSGIALKEFFQEIKRSGKKIAAFGATSKSTTIYNYAGVGPDLIDFISDNTPLKQEKFSPGVHIPVLKDDYFIENPPDFAFMAAWNHENEIRHYTKAFEVGGGRWITHIPKVRVLE